MSLISLEARIREYYRSIGGDIGIAEPATSVEKLLELLLDSHRYLREKASTKNEVDLKEKRELVEKLSEQIRSEFENTEYIHIDRLKKMTFEEIAKLVTDE